MLVVKNPPANAGDLRQKFDSWVGRFPGGGHCNPLQVGCLENPWTEEPGSLWSIGLERVRHDWSVSSHAHTHPEKSIKLKNTLFSSYIGKKPVFLYPVFLSCEPPLLCTQNTSLPTLLVTKWVEVFPYNNSLWHLWGVEKFNSILVQNTWR